jgi:hypothetical protein
VRARSVSEDPRTKLATSSVQARSRTAQQISKFNQVFEQNIEASVTPLCYFPVSITTMANTTSKSTKHRTRRVDICYLREAAAARPLQCPDLSE